MCYLAAHRKHDDALTSHYRHLVNSLCDICTEAIDCMKITSRAAAAVFAKGVSFLAFFFHKTFKFVFAMTFIASPLRQNCAFYFSDAHKEFMINLVHLCFVILWFDHYSAKVNAKSNTKTKHFEKPKRPLEEKSA